ncbi:MAG TPA: roadblock/LC7 domain-containing protein [Methanoregulaceae archaeon]|nr:roadblock/LC7 domain-containing protein [Methanoregulaceae archaeon]
MTLPPGKYSGIVRDPFDPSALSMKGTFTGLLEVKSSDEKGFILSRNGKFIAAFYRNPSGLFKGNAALVQLESYRNKKSGGIDDSESGFLMRAYTEQEYQQSLELCQEKGLIIVKEEKIQISEVMDNLDELDLNNLQNLPGVVAVLVFFEGFMVNYFGDVNFEQVAAIAEDFFRAGKKISADLDMGELTQILLESENRKCIITPYGDLNLCVVATSDANLGMIRLAISRIKMGVK